jgi:hypothetical protein
LNYLPSVKIRLPAPQECVPSDFYRAEFATEEKTSSSNS